MHNDVRLGTPFKLTFLFFVVLGLYYPAILSNFTQVDDPRIMGYLEDTNPTLLEIFRPGQSHYYRPLIFLTFYLDKWLWGLEPSFMHLENVLLHACNTLLVYFVTVRLFRQDARRLEIPLLSALLFAVHPINTEAVSWVSGRTDPLATVFILLAANFVADNNQRRWGVRAFAAAAAIFVGCLAKEVAFFFFPIAWLLLLGRGEILTSPYRTAANLRRIVVSALPFLLFSLSYLFLRQSGLKEKDSSVAMMLQSDSNWMDAVMTGFKAFGFYVKKLVMPLPLNFAITTYSDYYVWLGLLTLLLTCFLLLYRRRLCDGLLAGAFFLVLPAIIVAVKSIAWTPVAERYLYSPSAFFVIALVGWSAGSFNKKTFEQYLAPLMLLLTVAASIVTVQRNLLWQDTFRLYEDTARKSPLSSRVLNEYAIALIGQGKYDEAAKQLARARGHDKINFLVPMNQARIRLEQNDESGAIKILEGAYKDRQSTHPELLMLLARIREVQFARATTRKDNEFLRRELIDIYHYIYRYSKDPFIAYRSGQLLLAAGERTEAHAMFENAVRDAPKDAYYRDAARKLAVKLGNK